MAGGAAGAAGAARTAEIARVARSLVSVVVVVVASAAVVAAVVLHFCDVSWVVVEKRKIQTDFWREREVQVNIDCPFVECGAFSAKPRL